MSTSCTETHHVLWDSLFSAYLQGREHLLTLQPWRMSDEGFGARKKVPVLVGELRKIERWRFCSQGVPATLT